MENEFKPGDEVQHKTGGPKMIYVDEAFGGDALCQWMANGELKTASIPFVALKKYEHPLKGGAIPTVTRL